MSAELVHARIDKAQSIQARDRAYKQLEDAVKNNQNFAINLQSTKEKLSQEMKKNKELNRSIRHLGKAFDKIMSVA